MQKVDPKRCTPTETLLKPSFASLKKLRNSRSQAKLKDLNLFDKLTYEFYYISFAFEFSLFIYVISYINL